MTSSSGFSVAGRAVVITGAASGIGAALANEAALRGASSLALVDIDPSVEALAGSRGDANITVTCHSVDIADADAVDTVTEEILAQHGMPGLVCANAGVMIGGRPVVEQTSGDAAWVTQVNLLGTFHTMRAFATAMAEHDSSCWLMATGSEHSIGMAGTGAGLYAATKHAVLGLCDVLRSELPEHIGVSVLLPGLTTSRLWNAAGRRGPKHGGPAPRHATIGDFNDRYGMDPLVVAARALDGIERGNFLIPTHYNARTYADRRFRELDAAFGHLATIDTDDYDVATLADEFRRQTLNQERS